ncbi:MAG: glycoside hydrolase family 9 protein [Myxococcales bacterium]|nr:glycoside hydrolase family 9 protein [Myxococcales bacterium]
MFHLYSCILTAILSVSLPGFAFAADNGSQLEEKFRINYAGYLPQASKLALYISRNKGPISWSISGTSCSGTEDTYLGVDKSSGDSFYRIDFSECVEEGSNLRLIVGSDRSVPFDISTDPYGMMKYEFFDYFKDHETSATFRNAKNNWKTGMSVSFSYVRDAGDNGVYPTNTAEAAWSLINLLETYPAINTYYSSRKSGARSVYEQLLVLTEQFDHVFAHGGPLAIPKFHTNVNGSWASCAPHTSGTCISEPETKTTFAAARTLAAMARLHANYGSGVQANAAYQRAKTALNNALQEPLVCNQADSFGGEGGMYPDNDVYGLWRDPKFNRDNCVADRNNTEDDEYAALVENYLAALKLGFGSDARALRSQVLRHARFAEVSSFWWGAVAAEGSLSLLSNESLHDLNIVGLKSNVLAKAAEIQFNQARGYPGVTWDPYSDQWNNGDQDDADNNVRWGSHRMALNDARVLMAAANIQSKNAQYSSAAAYARSAIQVLDHISGLNAMNLAMYTATGYPEFEHAVQRTHDFADNSDQWPGKMVLGPNNWTNADDPDMPAFNSQPGLKMFAVTGTGWASREISIDANASLVPVAYFTTEIAPAILARDPLGFADSSGRVPAAPSNIVITSRGTHSLDLRWTDNSGSDEDAEQGFRLYQANRNIKPDAPVATLGANMTSWSIDRLQPDTKYYFWVEAFNAAGVSEVITISATTESQVSAMNYIRNGDFSSGSSDWDCAVFSGSGSCSVVNGEYVVSIRNGGTEYWHIQPRQEGLSLTRGKTYTFAFDARSTNYRNTEIKVERSVSPYEDFSQTGSGQSLTTRMQRFSYTFSPSVSLTDARVVMNVGNSNSTIYIDNIWLVEGHTDPCQGVVGCQ